MTYRMCESQWHRWISMTCVNFYEFLWYATLSRSFVCDVIEITEFSIQNHERADFPEFLNDMCEFLRIFMICDVIEIICMRCHRDHWIFHTKSRKSWLPRISRWHVWISLNLYDMRIIMTYKKSAGSSWCRNSEKSARYWIFHTKSRKSFPEFS